MYAVIKSGGKQYKVAPGDTIEIEKLPWEVGSQLELRGVVAVSKDTEQLLTGTAIADAKVLATIVDQGKGVKVRVFKFKRKKQYKRNTGHRQAFTAVKVTEIVA